MQHDLFAALEAAVEPAGLAAPAAEPAAEPQQAEVGMVVPAVPQAEPQQAQEGLAAQAAEPPPQQAEAGLAAPAAEPPQQPEGEAHSPPEQQPAFGQEAAGQLAEQLEQSELKAGVWCLCRATVCRCSRQPVLPASCPTLCCAARAVAVNTPALEPHHPGPPSGSDNS